MAETTNNQSNPFSTGQGGATFEHRVQSAFVVTMLTGGTAPCLPAWPISKIKLQGGYAGFNTDDCIVFVEEPGSGDEAKLVAQIRHLVTVAESNQPFAEAIAGAWSDFNNPKVFREGLDSIALITGPLSRTDTNDVRPLMEWARFCENADEFFAKVSTAGFSSESKRRKLGMIKAHLQKANGGNNVTDDVFWRFLKSFYLIGYDLDSTSGSHLSLLKTFMLQACDGHPDAIWPQVVEFVGNADPNAGTVTVETIPRNVRDCFTARPSASWKPDLQKLRDHGDYILQGIPTDISGVHIERRDLLCQLLDLSEQSSFVLVSGKRGSGKSTIVRQFGEYVGAQHPVFCLRTEDLKEPHLDQVFSAIRLHSSLAELAAGFAVMPKKYLLLESLEKLLELPYQTAFVDLLSFLKNNAGWTVIASARDYAYQQLTVNYLQPYGTNCSSLMVPDFTTEELHDLCQQIPALKPLVKNAEIGGLLRNPFYAGLAARVLAGGTQFSISDGEEAFRKAVWHVVIEKEQCRTRGLPAKRKRAFIGISAKRAKAMAYGVSGDEFGDEAVDELEADNLVRREPETGLLSPAHDVLEDWALDDFIDEAFRQHKGKPRAFLTAVGPEPAMNRAFRLWLERRLGTGNRADEVTDLVMAILKDAGLQTYCHDEVITAVLTGDDPLPFLTELRDRLFDDDGALLKRFCFVLRVACKAPDHDLIRMLSLDGSESSKGAESLYLRPYGDGWKALILFLCDNRACIPRNLAPHVLAVLDEWASLVHIDRELPAESREAGLLALHLLEMYKDVYRAEDIVKKFIRVIFRTVAVVKDEFVAILERDIFEAPDEPGRRRLPYTDVLLAKALDDFETVFLCRYAPEVVVRLARHTWFYRDAELDRASSDSLGVDHDFGLRHFGRGIGFFPASGLKGPFAPLLRQHSRLGLDFILSVCNLAAGYYAHSALDAEGGDLACVFGDAIAVRTVDIVLNDGTTVSQYCSARLWLGYRGAAVLPYLLQSALMALENWLVELVQLVGKCATTEWTVDHILRTSNSVMPTAVVASVATGFADILGASVLPLLRIPVLYELDLERFAKEISPMGAPQTPDPLWALHSEERRTSNARPWRQQSLDDLAFGLQFTDLREEVFGILDGFHAKVPEPVYGDETSWRFRLARMDTRNSDVQMDRENNRVIFKPKELESDLQEIQDQTREQHALLNRFLALLQWAEGTLHREPLEHRYFSDWRAALRESQALLELLQSTEAVVPLVIMHVGAIVKAAAVFLRDHGADLSEDDLGWCTGIVIEPATMNADTDDRTAQYDKSGVDGAPAAAGVLPVLLGFAANPKQRREVRLVIVTALTHGNATVREALAAGIRGHLWRCDPEFAQACVNGAIEHARLILEAIRERRAQWAAQLKEPDVAKPEPWLVSLRERVADCTVEPDSASITFTTHSAWHLLEPCLMIPEGSTALQHLSLLSRILALTMEHEEHQDDYRNDDPEARHIPVDFAVGFPQCVARHLLRTPLDLDRSLLDVIVDQCETAPEFVSSLLVYLFAFADQQNALSQYWSLWSELAPKAKEIAVRLSADDSENSRYDRRSRLLQRMLLADMQWQQTEAEQALLIPGTELILAFARTAGCNALVFEATSRFLFYFPGLFMPEGLFVLAAHQKATGAARLMGGTNTVFYLERVLQRLLVLSPDQSGISEELRDSSRLLLDAMIETGSSTAYFLRDYLLHSLCNR